MQALLIVVHLMLALALIGLVLMQRSEGGALGIGGGGGGNFMSARGQANFLTRATGILAACFMATSLVLAILAARTADPRSIIDDIPQAGPSAPLNADDLPAAPVADQTPAEGAAMPSAPTAPGVGPAAPFPASNAPAGSPAAPIAD